MRLHFHFRQKHRPINRLRRDGIGVIIRDVIGLNRNRIGKIPFVECGINFDFLDDTCMTQFKNRPVKSGRAAAAGFPCIAHIDSLAGFDDIQRRSVMRVAKGHATAAVCHGNQINDIIVFNR